MDSREALFSKRYTKWYGQHRFRILTLVCAAVLYVSVFLLYGMFLQVSSNYFVLIPMLAAAFGYGIPGGLLTGLVALPCNLLLFRVLGHPEYAPASLFIAECSGILVGGTFGFLGDRFRKWGREILARMEMEQTLRQTLDERNLLIREIHHRVKNNLAVIKGLISLQATRIEDNQSRTALQDMSNRIVSLSLIQDQLDSESRFTQMLDIGQYLTRLVYNLRDVYHHIPAEITMDISESLPGIHIDQMAPVGILVNEAITNAYKHALSDHESPALTIRAVPDGKDIVIVVSDNGPGYDGENHGSSHLGRTLMDSLALQVRGRLFYRNESGTEVWIHFPVQPGSSTETGLVQ